MPLATERRREVLFVADGLANQAITGPGAPGDRRRPPLVPESRPEGKAERPVSYLFAREE